MVQKEYRVQVRSEFYRALMLTQKELKEHFIILGITLDGNTKEFVFRVEASNNFHNKLSSYL
jgi:hypothetical protein